MSVGGSQQLRQFRRAIRDGATLEEACAASGNIIGPEEGKLYLTADAKNPPPEEAYRLLYDPDAMAAASDEKDVPMAKAAQEDRHSEEIPQKDFAQAVKIWRQDIKPAATKQGEHGQEQSTAYKEIKKNCHIQPQAAKLAFKVAEMEEAHRDDFLICLNGLFKELNIAIPRDLVTIAENTVGDSIIPAEDKPGLKLVGVDDEAPADPPAADSDEFQEASEEELAGQKPRADEAEAKKALKKPSFNMNPDAAPAEAAE